MTIPTAEFARAARWRESLNLSQAELGEQLGYSRMSVYWFEEGKTPPVRSHPRAARTIKPWVWQRYRLACAGLAAQLGAGKPFAWNLKDDSR